MAGFGVVGRFGEDELRAVLQHPRDRPVEQDVLGLDVQFGVRIDALDLSWVAQMLGVSVARRIRGGTLDSRCVRQGDLFVAVPGERVDGLKYVPDAIKAGAAAVVAERRPELPPGVAFAQVRDARRSAGRVAELAYGFPASNMRLIGITGTNGKTTTAHFTSLVLGEDKTETISTITNTDETQVEGPVTTPEAPSIHQRASQAFREGKENLVLEVSSHSLSLDRVRSVDFDCAVFTNLTRDHLDYHESMAAYGNEKLKLFQSLSGEDTAIVNSDDDFSKKIKRETQAEVLEYGLEEQADVMAREVEQFWQNTSFNIISPWGKTSVKLGFLGRYNVYNALAAATVGLVKGRELRGVVTDLESAKTLEGRMERIKLNNGSHIYVDFAHNPGALRRTLSELKDIYDSVHVVFGCGGERDVGKRAEMAKKADQHADAVVVTDDNPRNEAPEVIRTMIMQGFSDVSMADGKVVEIADRRQAIAYAAANAAAEDVILVAGKGHEAYQEINGLRHHYRDSDEVNKALNGRNDACN